MNYFNCFISFPQPLHLLVLHEPTILAKLFSVNQLSATPHPLPNQPFHGPYKTNANPSRNTTDALQQLLSGQPKPQEIPRRGHRRGTESCTKANGSCWGPGNYQEVTSESLLLELGERNPRSAGSILHIVAAGGDMCLFIQRLGDSVAYLIPLSNARQHSCLDDVGLLCGHHLFGGPVADQASSDFPVWWILGDRSEAHPEALHEQVTV